VARTVELLEGGATVPFIARYRKEATDGLDEVAIGSIQERHLYLSELVERKATIVKSIGEQGKLTDELRARIERCWTKNELEDLYLPYKPKRRTRATIAKEHGLEPLADRIWAQQVESATRQSLAGPFLQQPGSEAVAPKGGAEVERTVEWAFAGARDIVAERIAEQAELRAALREQALAEAQLTSRCVAGKEREAANYQDYFDYSEPVRTAPSHRVLALRRGEKEGLLRVAIETDRDQAVALLTSKVLKNPQASLRQDLELAIGDGYERLLRPAIETDVRLQLKERADGDAIEIFVTNLRQLLLQAPLGGKRVLALDPGFRTGCKVVVLGNTGELLAHDVIYPHEPQRRVDEARHTLSKLVLAHGIEAVAIGNGTAGRETESFAREWIASSGGGDRLRPSLVMVNESGASVYSASEVARQELPDHDVTVRGAVSIGRRLQDPLAELVKIDPKSIGVGQYQHDVNQAALQRALDRVVESCVSGVGVEVNTASVRLLSYVAGVGDTLAKNIVAHRTKRGPFRRRAELLEVTRLGPKAFEQCAGFLRIRGGDHPLDASAVHPERYAVVERMAKDLGVAVADLVAQRELLRRIELHKYLGPDVGEPTLRDILAELEKPGRDPRAEFEEVGFNPNVTELGHLQEGMVLWGVVTNVAAFGAFVDIGVHQDGLVHVSELAHRFVKAPAEVVKVGDRVQVKVVKLEVERRRIGLSIKACTAAPTTDRGAAREASRGPVQTPGAHGRGAEAPRGGPSAPLGGRGGGARARPAAEGVGAGSSSKVGRGQRPDGRGDESGPPERRSAPSGGRGGDERGAGMNTPFNSMRVQLEKLLDPRGRRR
jgi:uncharacterized protein